MRGQTEEERLVKEEAAPCVQSVTARRGGLFLEAVRIPSVFVSLVAGTEPDEAVGLDMVDREPRDWVRVKIWAREEKWERFART